MAPTNRYQNAGAEPSPLQSVQQTEPASQRVSEPGNSNNMDPLAQSLHQTQTSQNVTEGDVINAFGEVVLEEFDEESVGQQDPQAPQKGADKTKMRFH